MTFRKSARDLAMELSALKHVDVAAMQAAFDERARAAFMVAHPRKRTSPKEKVVRLWDGYQPLLDEATAELKAALEHFRTEKKRLEESIFEAVRNGDHPRAGKQVVQLGNPISSVSYKSQGYGAIHYARNAAETRADHARLYSIPAKVTEETPVWATPKEGKKSHPGAKPHTEARWFRVLIEVEHAVIDPLLIEHGPGPELIDQVRLCWKRGVNPRVYNPFLPHDFEAEHGLNSFGRKK